MSHTAVYSGAHFTYNSDLSGTVRITWGGKEMEVPGLALVDFVHAYDRACEIERLEQAE